VRAVKSWSKRVGWVDRTKFSGSMVLIAEAQQVKAKLQLKGRWRPDKMVRKKMPDGTGLLANVPQRRTSSRAVDGSVQDAMERVWVVAQCGRHRRG
jgi:hypothetical protein